MPKIQADELSAKLATLVEELALLEVHAVVLASFTNEKKVVTFGMEANTSHKGTIALLNAAITHMRDCH